MAWAELVLDYLRALIWPLTVLVLAMLFRDQLRDLIEGVVEFTGPGNLSFKRRTEAVKEIAEDAHAESRRPDDPSEPLSFDRSNRVEELDRYLALAEDDPAEAMRGAWRYLRGFIRDVTHAVGTDRALSPGASTADHVRTLVPLGLSEEMVGVARELSNLRNDVVKGRRIRTEPDTALNYIAAAEELVRAIGAVTRGRQAPVSDPS